MENVIHVDKCAAGKKANPMVGFYHEGKAHIYCSGWLVYATDTTCEECKACPGWIFGNQCYEDAKNCLKEDK